LLLYSDEASISVAPVLSRTYAPKGKTPCITVSTEINARLYMASAISPDGDLLYMVRNKPFDSSAVIEYLEYLRKTCKRKLLVIWDGASIHCSEEVKNWLAKQQEGDFFLAQQPHYSPELNADEQVWHHLKGCKLKDTCNQNVKELQAKIVRAMDEIKEKKSLVKAFFRHPKLGYY
jgi:transposase